MREILFRGKCLQTGEWVYGYVLIDNAPCSLKAQGKCKCAHDGSTASIFAWDDEFHEYEEYHVDPATVGQYTGLTDNDGREIFDGDVLEFINEYRMQNNKWKCVVEFVDGCFVCRYIEKEGHFGDYNHFDSWNVPLVKWWVIGNRWDDPELLEGTDNA